MLQLKQEPVWLIAAALLWSLNGTLTKYIVWSGLSCAILRGAITFTFISIVLRYKVWKISFDRYKFLCGICYFAQGMLLIISMKYTTAANATVLQNTSPLYIMLFHAILFRKLPKRMELITCVVLLAGVAMAFGGNFGNGGLLGNGLALGSAFFYAGVFFLSKMVEDPVEPVIIGNSFYILLLPLCLFDSQFELATPSMWVAQLALGLFCGAGAWLCFTKGIRETTSLTANFITMLEPIASAAISFAVLREAPSPLSAAGCAVVIVTLLMHSFCKSKISGDLKK